MGLHRNARLGLAGRRALVADVEAGCRVGRRRDAVASRRRRRVSGGVAGWRRREQRHRWPVSRIARRGRIGLRGCCRRRSRSGSARPDGDRLGAAADRRRDRACARDGLAGTRRAGISRPAREPREQPRRYEWPCPGDLLHIDTKRFVRFSRPGHAVTGDRHRTGAEMRMRVGYRVGALTRRRPLPLRLQRAPPRREGGNRDRLCRARPRRLRQHGIEAKRLMSDNAWTYTRNRATRPSCSPARHPPSADPATPPPGQRQGRALPADAQTRMGTRPDLPLQRPPRPGTVTLAQLLQRAQTTQLTRRPATDQPRPQRPEAGQLDGRPAPGQEPAEARAQQRTTPSLSPTRSQTSCAPGCLLRWPNQPPVDVRIFTSESPVSGKVSCVDLSSPRIASVV